MGIRQDLGKPLGRLLVVDDLVMLRKGVRIILEDAGFEVEEAGNGEEALHALQNGGPFDLVMTDLSMPGMTGLEWVRKANPPKEGRPVFLMMSAKIDPREVEEAKSIGIQEVMQKPYRREALIAKIDHLLGIERKKLLRQIEEQVAARRAAARAQKEKARKDKEKEKEKGKGDKEHHEEPKGSAASPSGGDAPPAEPPPPAPENR